MAHKINPKEANSQPTRNRVVCPSCNRPKLQFATKHKAILFIRYNGREIMDENGKYPCRAYYCPSCGCWHVTSQQGEGEEYYRIFTHKEEEDVTPEMISERISELEKSVEESVCECKCVKEKKSKRAYSRKGKHKESKRINANI